MILQPALAYAAGCDRTLASQEAIKSTDSRSTGDDGLPIRANPSDESAVQRLSQQTAYKLLSQLG